MQGRRVVINILLHLAATARRFVRPRSSGSSVSRASAASRAPVCRGHDDGGGACPASGPGLLGIAGRQSSASALVAWVASAVRQRRRRRWKRKAGYGRPNGESGVKFSSAALTVPCRLIGGRGPPIGFAPSTPWARVLREQSHPGPRRARPCGPSWIRRGRP